MNFYFIYYKKTAFSVYYSLFKSTFFVEITFGRRFRHSFLHNFNTYFLRLKLKSNLISISHLNVSSYASRHMFSLNYIKFTNFQTKKRKCSIINLILSFTLILFLFYLFTHVFYLQPASPKLQHVWPHQKKKTSIFDRLLTLKLSHKLELLIS